MGKKRESQLHIDTLAVLLLFLLFAVLVLSVLLTGARVYRGLVDRDGAAYEGRTAAQYLYTKLRQGDRAGGVDIAPFDGAEGPDALWFNQGEYSTRIYCYGGSLRELYALSSGDFSPQDGEVILEAEDLTLSRRGDLVVAELTLPGGSRETVRLHLRTGGGQP